MCGKTALQMIYEKGNMHSTHLLELSDSHDMFKQCVSKRQMNKVSNYLMAMVELVFLDFSLLAYPLGCLW